MGRPCHGPQDSISKTESLMKELYFFDTLNKRAPEETGSYLRFYFIREGGKTHRGNEELGNIVRMEKQILLWYEFSVFPVVFFRFIKLLVLTSYFGDI